MPSPIRKPTLVEPEDEHTFETPYGAFTLRRPTILMRRDIHLHAARGLQGLQNVDQIGEALNIMMATVEVCARSDRQNFQDTPTGWPREFGWNKVHEIEWLTKLFEEHSNWINSFRHSQQDDGNKESGSRGSKESGLSTPTIDGVGAS